MSELRTRCPNFGHPTLPEKDYPRVPVGPGAGNRAGAECNRRQGQPPRQHTKHSALYKKRNYCGIMKIIAAL